MRPTPPGRIHRSPLLIVVILPIICFWRLLHPPLPPVPRLGHFTEPQILERSRSQSCGLCLSCEHLQYVATPCNGGRPDNPGLRYWWTVDGLAEDGSEVHMFWDADTGELRGFSSLFPRNFQSQTPIRCEADAVTMAAGWLRKFPGPDPTQRLRLTATSMGHTWWVKGQYQGHPILAKLDADSGVLLFYLRLEQ